MLLPGRELDGCLGRASCGNPGQEVQEGPESWPDGAPAGCVVSRGQLHRSSESVEVGEHASVTDSAFPATARTSRAYVCDHTKHPLHDAHIRPHGR